MQELADGRAEEGQQRPHLPVTAGCGGRSHVSGEREGESVSTAADKSN